jgi:hypothetical protein
VATAPRVLEDAEVALVEHVGDLGMRYVAGGYINPKLMFAKPLEDSLLQRVGALERLWLFRFGSVNVLVLVLITFRSTTVAK